MVTRHSRASFRWGDGLPSPFRTEVTAIKSTRAAIKADRIAIKDALKQARQAVKDLRASFGK